MAVRPYVVVRLIKVTHQPIVGTGRLNKYMFLFQCLFWYSSINIDLISSFCVCWGAATNSMSSKTILKHLNIFHNFPSCYTTCIIQVNLLLGKYQKHLREKIRFQSIFCFHFQKLQQRYCVWPHISFNLTVNYPELEYSFLSALEFYIRTIGGPEVGKARF